MADGANQYVVDLGERLRLMRDGLINNSNLLVSAVIGILLVPIMLKGLGTEAYGLWLGALALCSMAGTLDLGILPAVLRVLAGDASAEVREETRQFVGASWKVYLLIGFAGVILNGVVGIPLSRGLGLSSQTLAIGPLIFLLAGASYCALQLQGFATMIFYSMRRFALTNLISVGSTVISATGVITILHLGGRLLPVAVWIVAVNWSAFLLAALIIRRLKPQLNFGSGRLRWAWLRPQVAFGVWSQLADLADVFHMQSGSLLIGTVLGSGAITPYAIGQKFPVVTARIQGKATDVIFPAASQAAAAGNLEATQQILETGMRWMVILMVPLYVGLAVVAPQLLQAWIGQTGAEEVAVLRLTCVALAAVALGGASEQVLWGQGQARSIFWIISSGALLNLALCFGLLHAQGLEGAAWALAATLILRSAAFIFLGARRGRMSPAGSILKAFRGAVVPLAACAVVANAVLHFGRLEKGPALIAACLAGGLAYILSLYFGGARPEERMLAHEILTFPFKALKLAWRALHEKLRSARPEHPMLFFLALLKRRLTYRPEKITAHLERIFAGKEDPFNCLSNLIERERYRYELEMLKAVRGGGKFRQALEVGCAEGGFTRDLAPLCQSLLAVDIAPTALARARERLRDFNHVRIERWDLRSDSLPEKYDLIVLTVLSNLVLPAEFHRARKVIVEALEPGGYLLMGDLRWDEPLQKTWWARRFFVGGEFLLDFMGSHPALEVVSRHDVAPWVHKLFRKV